jgi:hypothetical protein
LHDGHGDFRQGLKGERRQGHWHDHSAPSHRHGYGSAERLEGKVVGDFNKDEVGEPDPLLTFFAETGATDPAETPEKPRDPAPAPPPLAGEEFPRRLGHAERQLERAQIDISKVKTDLATLVSAVEDIRKRLSRPPERPAVVVPMPARARRPLRAPTIALVVLIALGAAAWGLVSATTFEVPGPPPIESVSSNLIDLPPIVRAHSPYTPVADRESPLAGAMREPRSDPSRPTYVGTLTIDADPAGDVFVDRRKVGRTPLRLEDLRAGSHLIWIERAGYRRWTRVVAVAANRISRVTATLDPMSR